MKTGMQPSSWSSSGFSATGATQSTPASIASACMGSQSLNPSRHHSLARWLPQVRRLRRDNGREKVVPGRRVCLAGATLLFAVWLVDWGAWRKTQGTVCSLLKPFQPLVGERGLLNLVIAIQLLFEWCLLKNKPTQFITASYLPPSPYEDGFPGVLFKSGVMFHF